MTTYNRARDYLLASLNAVGANDGVKAIAALQAALKERGYEELRAELESLSRTEFELASEELARRQDNADGTDANYPHMPEGYDNSKTYQNNPEDIPKGNSLDNYPSVRVDFLMDGKTGGSSGNYQGPELSGADKLAYPGVDGNGNEDLDCADQDKVPKRELMHAPLPNEPEPGSAASDKDDQRSIVESENQEGDGPLDIGEMFKNNNSDETGIREPDMTTLTPRPTANVVSSDPDKATKLEDAVGDDNALHAEQVARADGTAGSGPTSDSWNYNKDGLLNRQFDMNDFVKANPELEEELEDIDDSFGEEDEEDPVLEEEDWILQAPDEDYSVFDMDEVDANFAVDLMHSHYYPVRAAEDYPSKIWDSGEDELAEVELADSDGSGDEWNTEIDEQNASTIEKEFAALDKVLADTDGSGQEDSLDITAPIVGMPHKGQDKIHADTDQNLGDRIPGQFWYQHASISDPAYHLGEAARHQAELNYYRKMHAAAKVEGNVGAVNSYASLMKKANRWMNLHHNQHQMLLNQASVRKSRLERAKRNRESLE